MARANALSLAEKRELEFHVGLWYHKRDLNPGPSTAAQQQHQLDRSCGEAPPLLRPPKVVRVAE